MSTLPLIAIIMLLLGCALVLFYRNTLLRERYSKIIDLDEAMEKLKGEIRQGTSVLAKAEKDNEKRMRTLQQEYTQAKTIYERLRAEVALLEETLNDISFGLYKPYFNFETPDLYKDKLGDVYSQKKVLVKNGQAVFCPKSWTVNGSTREGAKMIKQESKLMLKAFNGECDASVAKVTWNNISKMEERIRKTFQAVNELGSVMQIRINDEYLNLSLSELRLTYELERKKHEIKEEQREIREQMRQEEIAQREFERAKKSAEEEEARYSKALEIARAEMEQAKESELNAITEKVRKLQERLADAQSKLQKAVSMAQITKTGHVYIISNIGSFGEEVFKIGMSRRLEPEDRVYELGSASVPFPYDIHAMIFSNDAPALEHAFHKQFDGQRLNLVNPRKEFFRVSIDDLEAFALNHQADIEFTKLAEAQEYRETVSRLEKALSKAGSQTEADTIGEEFPESLIPMLQQ